MRNHPSNLNQGSTMAFQGRRQRTRASPGRPWKAILHRPPVPFEAQPSFDAGHRRIDTGAARPRGVTLAAALVCLLVVMLFSSVVVRALVMRHRASRSDEQQLQCLFLIESAVERTKARCAAEPSFSGETWNVSLDDRGVARPGIASIRVEPVANEPLRRLIKIEARWPDDPMLRVQRTKELTITLPVPGAAS